MFPHDRWETTLSFITHKVIYIRSVNKLLFEAVKYFDSKCPRGNYTDFANFIIWWVIMEEYLKSLSSKNDASKAINEISTNTVLKNQLEIAWKKIHIQTWSGKIKLICANQPYKNSKTGHLYSMSNPNNPDLIELLRVTYCIRGNIIHGNDDPMNDTNVVLYSACADILAQWVRYLV